MSKKQKHNQPESIGKQLKRMNPSPQPFDATDDRGRDMALAFGKKYETLFKSLTDAVGTMIAMRDGDGLLLMDAALLGVCASIRDALSSLGVAVVPDQSKH